MSETEREVWKGERRRYSFSGLLLWGGVGGPGKGKRMVRIYCIKVVFNKNVKQYETLFKNSMHCFICYSHQNIWRKFTKTSFFSQFYRKIFSWQLKLLLVLCLIKLIKVLKMS